MIIRFTLTTASSPWNHKTNKQVHCSTRVAIKCTSVVYVPAQTDYPAVSTAIFVYRWDNHKYRFDHVATPTDLKAIPLMSEVENDDPKPTWCRSNSIDLILPEYTIAENFIKDVYDDVRFLGREIGAYKSIVGTTTSTIEATISS